MSKTQLPPKKITFTPSLKDLGFECCRTIPTDSDGEFNYIYITDLSKLNSLKDPSGNKVNFEINRAGYLTGIDDTQVYNDRSDKSFVTKTFHAAAEKNTKGQLKLGITIPNKTKVPQGGTKETIKLTYTYVMLPFTDNSTSSLHSSSSSSSIISQANNPRQSFKQEIIDPNKVKVQIAEIIQNVSVTRFVQMQSMFFHSENNPDPTVNFNTSQILSALFFATMLPSTDISANIRDIGEVEFYSKHSKNDEIIDLSLNIPTFQSQRQNIQRLMDTLKSFEFKFIDDDVDTSKFMSKKQRDANVSAGITNSIYMVPDPNGSRQQAKTITLLDLLRAAVTQLEKVRTVIGSGGPIDTFARQIQGGSKVNVKNNKQKTRRLHRNGHYNSRKRYD